MSYLPESLLNRLEGVKGFEREMFIEVHESNDRVVSVRINPAKLNSDDLDFISTEGFSIKVTPVPWSSTGYYLEDRPAFIFDPYLHGGGYYVQEASGMFLEQCMRQHADLSSALKVLDLCAAPGGKSTLLQSLINAESLLVSNEVIKTRVSSLTENMSKWGNPNNIVTNNDPRDFARMDGYFDVMVIDAPCSGSAQTCRSALFFHPPFHLRSLK